MINPTALEFSNNATNLFHRRRNRGLENLIDDLDWTGIRSSYCDNRRTCPASVAFMPSDLFCRCFYYNLKRIVPNNQLQSLLSSASARLLGCEANLQSGHPIHHPSPVSAHTQRKRLHAMETLFRNLQALNNRGRQHLGKHKFQDAEPCSVCIPDPWNTVSADSEDDVGHRLQHWESK